MGQEVDLGFRFQGTNIFCRGRDKKCLWAMCQSEGWGDVFVRDVDS